MSIKIIQDGLYMVILKYLQKIQLSLLHLTMLKPMLNILPHSGVLINSTKHLLQLKQLPGNKLIMELNK